MFGYSGEFDQNIGKNRIKKKTVKSFLLLSINNLCKNKPTEKNIV